MGEFAITSDGIIEEVTISDILGKIILQKSVNAAELSLQIKPAGIYFVRIKSDDQIYTRKLIVNNKF
jgi:hypothetical protein